MRFWVLVVLISCFVMSLRPAGAVELEGFEPIKFGMTKKEAMAPVNGEGRWETDDTLDYSYYWTEFNMKLTVDRFFRNGRAFQVHVLSH